MSDATQDPYVVAIERGHWPNVRTVYRICWHWLYQTWDVHWLGRQGHWFHASRGNQRYYRTFASRAAAERALCTLAGAGEAVPQ